MSAVAAPAEPCAPALTPERLLPWLSAYEERVAALTGWLGERECRRLGVPMNEAARRAWYAARAAWLGAAAPLSAFAVQANRLALLDAAALRRVLAARALYAWRGQLRRVVSGEQRRAMIGAVGEPAFAALLQLGTQSPPPGPPAPATPDQARLAASGHALILADGALTLALAARLVALTLNLAAPLAPLPPAPQGDGDSMRFLACAGLIFPEFTWLFG